MKYEQPYGVSDPNAPYINGNPSTGQMGSIPPAASIENPQREIVNTIADSGVIIPSDADLHQLAKAIQSGQLNFKHDTGTANAYATALVPNPGAYYEGLSVILKIGNDNTGPSVLNLNSIGNAPIVRADASVLGGGELIHNQYACFFYDGTAFRTVWALAAGGGVAGMPVWLTAPKDFYVDVTNGNDAWDGTALTHTTGVKGPFQTLQRAANEYPKYNLNGYAITIHVNNGLYNKVVCGPANGSGAISWVGSPSAPDNCIINSGSGSAVSVSSTGAPHVFNGFHCRSAAAAPGDPGFGIWSVQGADIILQSMAFGYCVGGLIACSEGEMTINGPIAIEGGGQAFLLCDGGRFIINGTSPPVLNVNIGVGFATAFIYMTNGGRYQGPWAYNSSVANVGGTQYAIVGNSVLNTFGQGAASIPGTTAGYVATGGQVL